MDDRLPNCVIASSNRFNDIAPYSSHIYYAEPHVWGSVFPWEFPQHATKEEEESFLRRFFSETDTHMQGGAHGDGDGFRFLKQVWYSNAIWNIDHRVPAVAKWWFEQQDNKNYLNDPSLADFIFKPDVKPKTFFGPQELDMYGENFLSYVIPSIQQIAKAKLEQQCGEKQFSISNAATVAQDGTAIVARGEVNPKAAQETQQETPIAKDDANQALQTESTSLASAGVSRTSPFATIAEQARPRAGSDDHTSPQDTQYHPRKRGNSSNRRFSNRGGYFHNRQPHSFNDRVAESNSLPMYVSGPATAYSQSRVASGGSVDLMQPVPQGQQLAGFAPPAQYGPPRFDQGGPTQYPIMNQVPFMHKPIYHITNTFNNRTNRQFLDHGFNGNPYPPTIDDTYNTRGGHRRSSHGSRGSQSRGFNRGRGRGSRGRNNFTASEQPPFAVQDQNFKPLLPNEYYSSGFAPQGRRGSLVGEKNWRSGSDRPQAQQSERTLKENKAPAHRFPMQDYQAMLAAPHNDYPGGMRSPDEFNHGQERMPPSHPPTFSGPAYTHVGHTQSKPQPFQAGDFDPEKTCTKFHIGARCANVKKLIVFYVPPEMSELEIMDQFRKYGKVEQAHRVVPKSFNDRPPGREPLVFVSFATSADASKFLQRKDTHWLDGRALQVEVPREYWDGDHDRFQSHWHAPTCAVSAMFAHQKVVETGEVPQGPETLRRAEDSTPTTRGQSVDRATVDETQSEGTTPTRSGASTPKRKYKKKANNRKKETDLRKASLTQHLPSESIEDNSDSTSVVTAINRNEVSKVEKPPAMKTQLFVSTNGLEKQHSGSAQTEVQTVSEPTFTPTENIETRLPVATVGAASTAVQPAPTEIQRSTSGETEVQTATEPTVLPTDDVATCLPLTGDKDNPHFRKDTKTEATKEAASVDGTGKERGTDAKDEPIGEAETPSKADDEYVDDSFHTAGGSPDSDQNASSLNDNGTEETRRPSATEEATETSTTSPLSETKDAECASLSEVVVKPASPEPGPSKDIKKIHIPALHPKPRTATPATVSESDSGALRTTERSTSGTRSGPPTAAYSIAPNTPVIHQDAVQSEDTVKTEDVVKSEDAVKSEAVKAPPESSKKIEKPKGPAQTESLSAFGKKKRKSQDLRRRAPSKEAKKR